MGIWVHPYAITPLEVGVDFRKIGVWLSPGDVIRTWLRLQSPVDCIPHPYHMNVKCFNTFICCGWASVCTLMLIYLWRWGWILGKLGVWLSPSGVVMSWLRLQSPVDCIPHPYHTYVKCFSTFICCGWAYRCTLIPLHQPSRPQIWGRMVT